MEAIVNTDQYKQKTASNGGAVVTYERAGATAREPADDSTSDAGDESVNNEQKEEQLWKVDTDRTMLSQVQDALERIENGTFGNCLADGEPIDEKRLEAMPWTPYCPAHQQQLEKSQPRRTATL
jgi:DnaK suppressor protein